MTCTKEHAMMNLNPAGAIEKSVAHVVAQAAHAARLALHDFDQQRLRILRCTAHAMAISPGGLRFKAGTKPWLEGLSAASPGQRRNKAGQVAAA
jgi:hypothetical protein